VNTSNIGISHAAQVYATPGVVIPGARTIGTGFGTYWAVKPGAGRMPGMLIFLALTVIGFAPLDAATAFVSANVTSNLFAAVATVALMVGPLGAFWALSHTRVGVPAALAAVLAAAYTLTLTDPVGDIDVLFAACLVAVLHLAAVVAHEAAHAVVGVRTGLHLRGMVLASAFAACSFVEDELTNMPNWKSMAYTAVVGPLTSLGCGFGFVGIATMHSGPAATALNMVGFIHIGLGVMNAMPVLPMDGGLTAAGLLWRRHPEWTCQDAIAAVRPWAAWFFPVLGVASVVVAALSPSALTVIIAIQMVGIIPMLRWSAKLVADDNEALRELRQQELRIERQLAHVS
jgi:hypothetical protein